MDNGQVAQEKEKECEDFKLGKYYSQFHIKDYAKAIEHYKKSAEAGNSCAMCNLGLFYSDGTGVEQNISECRRLYSLSAIQGNPCAQYNLAAQLSRSDPDEAFRLFHSSASQGNLDAIYRLAKCYELGQGVDVNAAESQRLYELSADHGYEYSREKLGGQYLILPCKYLIDMRPLPASPLLNEAIIRHHALACERNLHGMFRLAKCYEFGKHGVEKDLEESKRLYEFAAAHGHRMAMHKLGARIAHLSISTDSLNLIPPPPHHPPSVATVAVKVSYSHTYTHTYIRSLLSFLPHFLSYRTPSSRRGNRLLVLRCPRISESFGKPKHRAAPAGIHVDKNNYCTLCL